MNGTLAIELAMKLIALGQQLYAEGNREATDAEVAALIADSKAADADLVKDIADRRARDKDAGG